MACFIDAATYVETCLFGEIVDLPPVAYGVNDTQWDPPPQETLATSRNFPAARICPRLTLVRDGTKALVREFWYKPDPDPDDTGPRYDCPEPEDAWCYARLLSKDSHYIDVGYTLIAVAISFSSLLTQLQLALQCILQGHLFTSAAAHSLRFWFPGVFLAKIVALLTVAFARARRKIKKDPGDLRPGGELGGYGRCTRLLCMMLFNMFDVPAAVTDVLNLAHVTKPNMPFAVFRKGGSRMWIVGWFNRSHFQVDMEFSSMPNLKVSIIFDMPLVIMQFLLAHDAKLSVSLLMTMLTSLLKLVYSMYKALRLYGHRNKYYANTVEKVEKIKRELVREREEGRPIDERKMGTLRTLRRDLTYHFGDPYPPALLPPRPAGQGLPLLPPAS